tara:strand:+ start:2240 stop:3331 length:1092 start_codon:yes stop_codon:yes gene_type:complete
VNDNKFRVAIIGCGRLGQHYGWCYDTFPDTEIVAIAEHNPDRLKRVGEIFGVKALYPDADSLLKEVVPDVASVVTPTKFMKDAVIACAEAGVKGVTTDKPIAARLSDADAMIEACASRGVVFGGGNLQRAMNELQETNRRFIRSGEIGDLVGASIHGFGGEISGGGCQHICVLTLLTDAVVQEVIAWASPAEALDQNHDEGLVINGRFLLSNGLQCQVFGQTTPSRGVDVWSQNGLVRWDWNPPEVYKGLTPTGQRQRVEFEFEFYEWSQFYYLTSSLRSFLATVAGQGELFVSGDNLRHALEVAIACKQSALMGNIPVSLPLTDRSLALEPRRYRWLGGDADGKIQSMDDIFSEAPNHRKNK